MNIQSVQKFILYPVNKSSSYSYYKSSPTIEFQFNNQNSRLIDRNTLRLYYKLNIVSKTNGKLPANVFDVKARGANQADYEYVSKLNPKVAASSAIESLTVSNMVGQTIEQVKQYNRNLASIIPATSSLGDLSTLYQNTYASEANVNGMERKCSGSIPCALRLNAGYLQKQGFLPLNQGGLNIKIQLASDNRVLCGLNASEYYFELKDVYLAGKYLVLDKPLDNSKQVDEYVAYYSYMNVLQSSLSHSNLNLALGMVIQLYQNFIPSTWNNNFLTDSMATPPLLEYENNTFEEKTLTQANFMRGAVRFPMEFPVDGPESWYQTLRSRLFLNSIYSYSKLQNTMISPVSENVSSMVPAKSLAYPNPLQVEEDQGLLHQWQFQASDNWAKSNNNIESAANVFGVGIKLDQLSVGSGVEYKTASYNYTIQSLLNTTANNSNVYALAAAQIMMNQGQIMVSM